MNLAHNNITGSTPASICKLAALEEMTFQGNTEMEGSIPPCLGDCTNLTRIDYTRTTLRGTIPAGLCALEKLRKLMFQFTTGLTGTILDCLGAIQPMLKWVLLEGNMLEGTIPGVCGGEKESPRLWAVPA